MTSEQLQQLQGASVGEQVVELEVEREGDVYQMVGVLMQATEDSVRIAFSSKDDRVVDALTLPAEEIVGVRLVPESEISQV